MYSTVETYFASKSYKDCQQRFGQKFPGIQVPNNSTIVRLIQRFRDQGSVADRGRRGRPTVMTAAVCPYCMMCSSDLIDHQENHYAE